MRLWGCGSAIGTQSIWTKHHVETNRRYGSTSAVVEVSIGAGKNAKTMIGPVQRKIRDQIGQAKRGGEQTFVSEIYYAQSKTKTTQTLSRKTYGPAQCKVSDVRVGSKIMRTATLLGESFCCHNCTTSGIGFALSSTNHCNHITAASY